ncbi:centrosomal protein 20 isoform X2 [Alexandromys fortis]|uniref:centrosomal protein 20 isoform X2 n=1 Tax=Alexandromys fortis TaxID=100897 RepID=UPI0021521A54|nr:centrosomal protein 20 isoform X2 [Microtus fortis]
MASVTELKAVLKDTLEKRGVLGHLKARIRAEVFNALDDDQEPRPSLSHENLLINELIREYLEFNKYKYTASVLIAESGQPVVPLDRQFLIRELNAFEESKDNSIPFLAWSSRWHPECASDRVNTSASKQASQLEAQQKTKG